MGSLVRLLALAASAVIALSLIMFALDQSGEGRESQLRSLQGQSAATAPSQAEIDLPGPSPEAERLREEQHSSPREVIDDGNDVLLSPFTGLVGSDNAWLQRMVPAVLGLLLFGLGGLMLANWLPERRETQTDWRQPAA